jgi:predicted AlkP superfamily pyrophosphatase or phosphodiesterase
MTISSSKIVILSLIFAIVLSLTMSTVTAVVFSEQENAAENVDGILLPADPPTTPYEHVILIVLDGVRPDTLIAANTPNIDNLVAEGSYTWNAWTVTPSVTLSAIPSIFTGATPEVHGVTDWHGEIHAETIVEVFEEAGLPCAIVGEDPILGGYSATYCTGFYATPDPAENFMSIAIDLLRENHFYFIAIYNPVPDEMGHSYGSSSPQYRAAIEDADYQIGRLVENLKELGVYENTLIVITPDHGMTGTSHSSGYATDMRIFSVWHGPGVKQGYEMVDSIYIPAYGNYGATYVAHRIIDIAPTIAELVGVRPPENAEGEVIRQIFEEVKAETPPPGTSPLIYVGAVVVIVAIIAAVLIIKKPF